MEYTDLIKFVRKLLIKVLSKKIVVIFTIIWCVGFFLSLMADTDLFTENSFKLYFTTYSSYSFSFYMILFFNVFYFSNRNYFKFIKQQKTKN